MCGYRTLDEIKAIAGRDGMAEPLQNHGQE